MVWKVGFVTLQDIIIVGYRVTSCDNSKGNFLGSLEMLPVCIAKLARNVELTILFWRSSSLSYVRLAASVGKL